MDVGQGNANALWQQATSGTFRMEPGAAQEFTRLVDTVLEEQLQRSERLSEVSGFGGFDSARELQAGSRRKGRQQPRLSWDSKKLRCEWPQRTYTLAGRSKRRMR